MQQVCHAALFLPSNYSEIVKICKNFNKNLKNFEKFDEIVGFVADLQQKRWQKFKFAG
jgi:hypothetical protein